MEDKKNLKNKWISIAKQYDLFIFDFDGTITQPLSVDWIALKKELHALLNKPFSTLNTMDKLLYEIRNVIGESGIKKAYNLINEYEKMSIKNTHINNNFQEILTCLPKNKKKAIFSTNMKNTIKTILLNYDLLNHFNVIISKEDISKYKPDPEGLLIILNNLKIPALKAIYIGNMKSDLIAGRKAHIKTILIS